jgi:hypothetical protein
MDVLLVGVTPELLPRRPAPCGLVALRAGRPVPSGNWDVAFLRADAGPADLVTSVARDVRPGGTIVFVSGDQGAPHALARAAGLVELGWALEPEAVVRDSGLVLARRPLDDGQDLVGLRRSVRQLERHVGLLESLVAGVTETVASVRPPEGLSIKEVVGLLGDLDRGTWLRALKEALGDADPADPVPALRHDKRVLDELVVRYRHLRAQSLAYLDGLPAEAFRRPALTPGREPVTVAGLLQAWTRREAALLSVIAVRVGRPGPLTGT